MESQGKGKRVRDICAAAVGKRRSGLQIKKVQHYVTACVIACLALLWGSLALATSYVYDANGRVVAATQSNGQSAQYVYDNLGNLVQVTSLASGQLAVFAFTPSHGEAGTEVTIQGQGFSTTLANDAVKFNGTTATVLSATATQIVTEVPAGATTGPISVTVSSATAQSTTSFVVDNTGEAPTITSVSPTLVASGSSVTVIGTNLDPVPGQTNVVISGIESTLTSITNTQLQITPISSGNVVVQTPYGQATSSNPIVVLPPGFTTSQVTSVQTAVVNGASITMNVPTGSQWNAVQFTGTAGSWPILETSALTPAGTQVSYRVYSPDGTLVQLGNDTIFANEPSVVLPQFAASGIYTVVFESNAASTQMGLQVVTAPTLSSGVPVNVSTSAIDQIQRVIFNASAGQTLTIAINSATTSPSNAEIQFTVYDPSGAQYAQVIASGPNAIDLPNLVRPGTYQVVMQPWSTNATLSTQVELFTDTVASQPANGTTESYTVNSPVGATYFNFAASQGQNLELTLTNPGTSTVGLSANIYNVAGTNIGSLACNVLSPNATCRVPLWNMPAGVYSVVVNVSGTSTETFDAVVSADASGGALAAGTPASLNLTTGEVERFTFSGTAGQNAAIGISNIATTPAGQLVEVYVYRPDVGVITTGDAMAVEQEYTNGTINLPNLPVSGNYTVIVAPVSGSATTAQLEFGLQTTTTQAVNDTAVSYAPSDAGQNAYFNFMATQGQNLELTIANLTVTGGSSNEVQILVTNSAGTEIASSLPNAQGAGSVVNIPLWNLDAGTYSVSVVSEGGSASQLSFNATLQADIVGPALTAGTAQNISLGTGSVERLTFTGTAGQAAALALTSISTTPSNEPMYVTVYRPDTGEPLVGQGYTQANSTTAATVNIESLPVSGTYTVIVQCGFPSTAQLTLVSGAKAIVATNGTPTSLSTTVTNENAYLTFTATQGQNLELALSNLVQTNTSNEQVTVSVSGPTSGLMSGNTTICEPNNPGGSCDLSFWNLSAGTYVVTITPYAGGMMQFNASLSPDVVGPALTANTPQNVTLGAGQVERLTFTATAGSTVAFQISNTTTTPSGSPVYANVYSPNGEPITRTNFYASTYQAGSSTLNLMDLPFTGTYTIVIYDNYGIPATATVEVASGAAGTQPTNGTVESYSTVENGQNAYLSFTATQDQDLQLTFDNLSFSGSTDNQFDVKVLNATNTIIYEFTCGSSNPGSSCTQTLWGLNAGAYSLLITPDGGGTAQFHTVLEPFTAGSTMALGTPVTANLSAGEVEQLSFNANLYDTVVIKLANPSTTPSGQPVYVNVYAPNVGLMSSSNYIQTATLTSGTDTLTLSNLSASGGYQVLASTAYGLPGSLQLTEVSDTAGSAPTPGSATLPTTGAPQSEAGGSGQNITMTFNATQGQNIELTFDSVTISNGEPFNVTVTDPFSNVTTFSCDPDDGFCSQSLWNLTEGTYTVVAQPVENASLQFNAIAQPDLVGGTITSGTPVTVDLATGQGGRYTFTGTQGENVTLALSNFSINEYGEFYIDIYRPDGGLITPTNYYSQTEASYGSPVVNLTDLPASGTYTIVVTSGGFPGSLQMTLGNTSTATLPTTGQSSNYSTTIAGQNEYLTFSATQGQNLELTLNNIVQPSFDEFDVDIYDWQGNHIAFTECYQSAGPSCTVSLWNLAAGNYSIIISKTEGPTSFTAQLQPDTSGGGLTLGTPANVSVAEGQAVRYTFSGTAGGNMVLELSNVVSTPAGQSMTVSVYSPSAGAITTSNYLAKAQVTSTPAAVPLSNLPATGTYTAIVTTEYGNPTTAQLSVVNESLVTQPANSTSENYSTSISGQDVYLDFAATQGQNIELTFDNITSTQYGISVSVTAPDGASLTQINCSSGTPCALPLWNLDAGTYSIVVSPWSTGTMQFTTVIAPDVAGGTLVSGTAQNLSITEGQAERFTFSGTAGQTVGLDLSGLATTPTGQPVDISVYRPDLGVITTTNAYASTSTTNATTTLNLSSLPVSGTYTVIVNGNLNDAVSGQLTLVGGDTSALTVNGSVVTETSTSAGENVGYSFTATQGQNLELIMTNFSVTGGADQFNVSVYNSGNSLVQSALCQPGVATVCDISLWNLAAGKYTVIATPPGAGVLQVTTQLAADISGGALTSNTATSVNLAAGMVERFTFTGTANVPSSIQFSNVATTPSGNDLRGYVYLPGSLITPTNAYASGYAVQGSTGGVSLPSLPVSGTYTVVVKSDGGEPVTAQVTPTGVVGTLDTIPTNYTAAGAYATVTTTFVASSGQNLELTMSNVSVTGASTDGFEVNVTNPQGEPVANFFCYASTPGASCSQSLWNLPPGTYTVTASPIWGGVLSFTGVVIPDVSGPTLTSGTAAPVTLTEGQVERVKFAGTAGNAATLQLTAVNTTPANQPVYLYLYLPNVGTITSTDSYEVLQATTSNTLSIPSLPVTGTYTAVIATGTGIPASSQVTYTQ